MNDDIAALINIIKLIAPPGKLAQAEEWLAPLEEKYAAGMATWQPPPPAPPSP